MSQKELANSLNLAPATLCRYETGTREADYATLIKCADFFDVSVDFLIGRANSLVLPTKNSTSPFDTSLKEEMRLLEYFRSLNTFQQGELMGVAKTLANKKTD